jgi:hypothetical protein
MRYFYINENGYIDTKEFASNEEAKAYFTANGIFAYDLDLDKIQEFYQDQIAS